MITRSLITSATAGTAMVLVLACHTEAPEHAIDFDGALDSNRSALAKAPCANGEVCKTFSDVSLSRRAFAKKPSQSVAEVAAAACKLAETTGDSLFDSFENYCEMFNDLDCDGHCEDEAAWCVPNGASQTIEEGLCQLAFEIPGGVTVPLSCVCAVRFVCNCVCDDFGGHYPPPDGVPTPKSEMSGKGGQ